MYIKSYSQLQERKALKKEQLTYMRAKLYTDYFQLIYTAEKIKDGLIWWKNILFGIEIYKQAKGIFQHFRKRR